MISPGNLPYKASLQGTGFAVIRAFRPARFLVAFGLFLSILVKRFNRR